MQAQNLHRYWVVRELGVRTTALAMKLRIFPACGDHL